MSRVSDEMKGLVEHQKQIKGWLSDVNSKIVQLEEAYLEETTLGNVVRGWEIDGSKPLAPKFKWQEDRERIFSLSSYQAFLDSKNNQFAADSHVGEKRGHHASSNTQNNKSGSQKAKKHKKTSSKKNDDLDYSDGDY
jgi:Histone acetyltransferase subunit NuA4